MAQRDARLIGGTYRLGPAMATSDMLTTYTATQLKTLEMVGIFVIEFPPSFHAQTVQHFLKPLERYTHVQSAHVLQVLDWGVDANRAYIATNAPRGIPLRYMLDTEHINLTRALDVARQITQGLIALHAQGIVGLDLRPQLITIQSMQSHDLVQIDDIGLRPLLNALGNTTVQSASDISYLDPRYAPPEYLQGDQIGQWSDIYQVGLLLFELVTGRVPFIGHNDQETIQMQCNNAVPRLSLYSNNAPLALQELINRTLAKAPQERFASAHALFTALNTMQQPTRSRDTQVMSAWAPDNGNEQEEDSSLMATVLDKRNPDKPQRTLPGTDGIFAYLYFEKDGSEQKIAIKQANIVIGRKDPRLGKHLDIDLTDLDTTTTVSRNHASITFEQQSFYLEDLKSRNKTRLNGIPLSPRQKVPLHQDDIISCGSVRLIFKLPG